MFNYVSFESDSISVSYTAIYNAMQQANQSLNDV